MSQAATTTALTLVSVNVGLPKYLGEHRGRPVTSGIAKEPVTSSHLWLDWTNLEGDGQAELDVHGGPDKAVYGYASESIALWAEEFGEKLAPGAFGENLTTAGWSEDDVCIGDRWLWGEAVLEVCQPRWPCYKLAMYRRRGDIARRMHANGRTGWYLRVVQTGRVPVAGPVEVARHAERITVRMAHEAAGPRPVAPGLRSRLLALDPLADGWRDKVAAQRTAGD